MRFTPTTIWTRLAIVMPADVRKNVQLIKMGYAAVAKINPKIRFLNWIACKVWTRLDVSRHFDTYTYSIAVFACIRNVIKRNGKNSDFENQFCTRCSQCSMSHPTSSPSSSSSECNSSYFIWQQTLCMHEEKVPTSFCAWGMEWPLSYTQTLSFIAFVYMFAFNERAECVCDARQVHRVVAAAACATNRFIHQRNNFLTLVWRKSFSILFVRSSQRLYQRAVNVCYCRVHFMIRWVNEAWMQCEQIERYLPVHCVNVWMENISSSNSFVFRRHRVGAIQIYHAQTLTSFWLEVIRPHSIWLYFPTLFI